MITTNYKMILTALVFIILISGGTYIKALKAENKNMNLELAQARREAESLKKDLKFNWQALEEKYNRDAALKEAARLVKEQFEVLYDNDKEVKNWADGLLPDALIKRLRH